MVCVELSCCGGVITWGALTCCGDVITRGALTCCGDVITCGALTCGVTGFLTVLPDKTKALIRALFSLIPHSISSASMISCSSSSGSLTIAKSFSSSSFNTVLFLASCSILAVSEAICMAFRASSFSIIVVALFKTLICQMSSVSRPFVSAELFEFLPS